MGDQNQYLFLRDPGCIPWKSISQVSYDELDSTHVTVFVSLKYEAFR